MSKALCPSSPAKEGALLIGVVVGDTLAFLQPAPIVTDEALSQAGGRLEERFRFSLPCLCDTCHNFSEGRCELIHRLLSQQTTDTTLSLERTSEDLEHLPNCPIRSRCQWFGTAGVRACSVCPAVRYPASKAVDRPHDLLPEGGSDEIGRCGPLLSIPAAVRDS